MTTAKKLLETLPTCKDFDFKDGEIIEVFIKPHAFIQDEDDTLMISAENGDGLVDYYGEFRGGDPYIHEDLEKWAKENDGMWEWINPSSIGFYK
tara:strand:- start:144 stop:425 length:282 start_codon:yes stop_codon:yes gene_type:complete